MATQMDIISLDDDRPKTRGVSFENPHMNRTETIPQTSGPVSLDILTNALKSRCHQRSIPSETSDSTENARTKRKRHGPVALKVEQYQNRFKEVWIKHKGTIGWIALALFLIAYAGYFGYALSMEVRDNVSLIVLTVLVYVLFLQYVVRLWYGNQLSKLWKSLVEKVAPIWKKYLRWSEANKK